MESGSAGEAFHGRSSEEFSPRRTLARSVPAIAITCIELCVGSAPRHRTSHTTVPPNHNHMHIHVCPCADVNRSHHKWDIAGTVKSCTR